MECSANKEGNHCKTAGKIVPDVHMGGKKTMIQRLEDHWEEAMGGGKGYEHDDCSGRDDKEGMVVNSFPGKAGQ